MGSTPVRRIVKNARLTVAEGDGNLDSIDQQTPVVKTISSDTITVEGPGTYHLLPQTGTTDTLSAINGAQGREWRIILCLNVSGHTITVTHNPPNLNLATSTFLLNSLNDTIILADRTVNVWREIGRTSVP